MRLTDLEALTFDCFGTLIDWAAGMIEGLKPLTSKVGQRLARNQILATHARREASQQLQRPAMAHRNLLPIIYCRLVEEWGVATNGGECVNYGSSVKNFPAFADSVGALQYLKRHHKMIALSNVDNQSSTTSNEKLQVHFDAIYTAEDAGSYKPSDRNFNYMLAKMKTLGIEKHEILHTTESMFHDNGPANKHGLALCWIYRRHDQEGFGATMNPGAMPKSNFRFNSMADLVKAH